MKELLVITMYSGEQDLPFCLKSLERQTFQNFSRIEIAGLANYEAHEKLYTTIDENRGHFTYFLKLDADMVFRSDEGLACMLDEMRAATNCDHATWHVLDFLSETQLRGVHMFSNRARWHMPLPRLFVDPDPEIPGRRISYPDTHEAYILHAPFPSKKQAFQFGLHRGTKCFAQGDNQHNSVQRYFQYKLLNAIWDIFLRTKDPLRGMALLGAEWARTQPTLADDYRKNAVAQEHFEIVRNLGFEEIFSRCKSYWGRRRKIEHARHWYNYKTEVYRQKRSRPTAV